MTTPLTPDDFTSVSLLKAWKGFKRAVERIDEKLAANPKMSPGAHSGFIKLRDQHLQRIQTLEEAQRIINTHRMIQGDRA